MKLAILVLLLTCASIAGGAKAASLDGRWTYTFPCDSRPGRGDDRCTSGEKDAFELTVVEQGDRLCGDYMLTWGFGNRVDEADVDWPLERNAPGEAHVKFRFQGGGGEALLHVEDNQMLWRIVSTWRDPQSGFWVTPPNLAVLTRLDEAAPANGHPKCGDASIAPEPPAPSQTRAGQLTQGDVSGLVRSESAIVDAPRFVPREWPWPSPADAQAHGVCADRLRASSQLAFAQVSTLTQASLILTGMTSDHDRAVARMQATSAASNALTALAREKQRAQAIAGGCDRFDDVRSSAQKLIAGLDAAVSAIRPIAVKLDALPPAQPSSALIP